jgi:hypothetical protein
MSNRHAIGGRDKNEHIITDVLEAYGYPSFKKLKEMIVSVELPLNVPIKGFYQQGSEPDGYDLRIFDDHGVFIVEIKNPALPPSKRRLTASERLMQELCNDLHIPWYRVETPEEMQTILEGRT